VSQIFIFFAPFFNSVLECSASVVNWQEKMSLLGPLKKWGGTYPVAYGHPSGTGKAHHTEKAVRYDICGCPFWISRGNSNREIYEK